MISYDTGKVEEVSRFLAFVEAISDPESLKKTLKELQDAVKQNKESLGLLTTVKQVDAYIAEQDAKLAEREKAITDAQEALDKATEAAKKADADRAQELDKKFKEAQAMLVLAEKSSAKSLKDAEALAEQLDKVNRERASLDAARAEFDTLQRAALEKELKLRALIG